MTDRRKAKRTQIDSPVRHTGYLDRKSRNAGPAHANAVGLPQRQVLNPIGKLAGRSGKADQFQIQNASALSLCLPVRTAYETPPP